MERQKRTLKIKELEQSIKTGILDDNEYHNKLEELSYLKYEENQDYKEDENPLYQRSIY